MRFLRVVATAGLLLTPYAAAAQEPVDSDPPAHVSFVDGTAVIERDGKTDPSPTNMPLLAGDRIRTESGRVEILYADGSTLHVDNFTTIDFQSDELVRVLDGRATSGIASTAPARGRRFPSRANTGSRSRATTAAWKWSSPSCAAPRSW